MPAERLSMRKVREVLRPKYACGASVRTIARSVAVGHTTVAEYLRRPTVIGITLPVPSEIDDTRLERRLFAPTGFYTAPTRAMPDWNHVHAELRRRGVTLLLLWEHAAVAAEQHVGMDKRSSAAAAPCRIRSGAATLPTASGRGTVHTINGAATWNGERIAWHAGQEMATGGTRSPGARAARVPPLWVESRHSFGVLDRFL
jgi:hypothetical protein